MYWDPDEKEHPFRLDGVEEADEGGLEEEDDEELDSEEQRRIDDGEVCGSCGEEFVKEQGVASLCKDCWEASTVADRDGFVLATSDTVRGTESA